VPSSERPDTQDAQLLSTYLAERDVPCPRCGYNLRALTSGRCPECGDELQLQVGLVEPRLRAYVALLVACCFGCGGSMLFGAVALNCAPSGWWTEPCAVVLLVQLLLSGVMLLFVLRRRRQFRKASRRVQWTLAVAAWLLITALSTAFVVLFPG
jgi:hypothetical protein